MKLKYLLTAVLIFAATENLCAQLPNWKWARTALGNEYDQASTVATDANGNVYVSGYYTSDSIIIGTVTLPNAGLSFNDMFLAKYDSSGNFLWAQRAGSTMSDRGVSLATDGAGNVYLTGYFYSPTITFGTYTFTNAGNVGDVFIVKYDSNGNVLWATKEGGPGLEIPFSINVDATGNIVVAGRFSSSSVTFGTTTLTLAGSMDVFIVKYDAAGNVLWAKGAGGGSNDEAYSVDVDASGNVLVAGYFNSNALFGTINLTTAGQADVFVAKYDASGNVLWAERAGGGGDDRATGLAVDAAGNIYIAGFFTIDPISFGSIVLPVAAGDNSFVAKYDASGTVQWAHGLSGDSKALALTVTSSGIYVCGFFQGDTLTYGPAALLIDGNTDFFLLKCDFSGTPNWAIKHTSGGGSSDAATAITADAWGNIVIGGYLNSDPITFGPTVLINADGFEMFVARLGDNTTGTSFLQNENEIGIYPNPGNGELILYSDAEIKSVEIYTLTGIKVYTLNEKNQQAPKTISISSLPAGIYFVKAMVGERLYTKKLIVE